MKETKEADNEVFIIFCFVFFILSQEDYWL
jgi:hypothetical protein